MLLIAFVLLGLKQSESSVSQTPQTFIIGNFNGGTISMSVPQSVYESVFDDYCLSLSYTNPDFIDAEISDPNPLDNNSVANLILKGDFTHNGTASRLNLAVELDKDMGTAEYIAIGGKRSTTCTGAPCSSCGMVKNSDGKIIACTCHDETSEGKQCNLTVTEASPVINWLGWLSFLLTAFNSFFGG